MTLTTHRPTPDGDGHSETLSYARLEQPWQEWAKIARNFVWQLDDQWDREDLMHDIIVRLAEVAEEYRQKGKPLTKWGCIRVAEYTRLRFYRQKKRWRRVFAVSLNGVIRDEDGYETEMVNTLSSEREFDLDAWLDAKTHYLSSPERVKRAICKLPEGTRLSGYDWKLIRQFRTGFAAKMRLG